MTVFISWSGSFSKEVAELLNSWLPDVIQDVETWLSSEDIEKGSIWSEELNEALKTTVGIICVTRENKDARWLLFEAGALSKGLTKARVCPLLIDLQSKDLQPPLSIFNLTLPEREEMWRLVKVINKADPDNALAEKRLEKSFNKWWEVFDDGLKVIREKYKTMTKAPERSDKELVAEILDISRAIQRAVERIESKEKLEFRKSDPDAFAKWWSSVFTPFPPNWKATPELIARLRKVRLEKEASSKAEKHAEKQAEIKSDERKSPK